MEDLPDAPVELDTDVDGVMEILDNLLENAARYAGSGTRVLVSVLADQERTRISVTDNGPGIDPADLPRLFDRFYRGEGRSAGGLGIGLYASRALAEELGGLLTAHSAPGEGATFMLELPLRRRRWIDDASTAAATAP